MTNTKVEFLKKFNDAFLKPDIPFILDSLTDDVEWTMVGDRIFQGKEEVKAFFDNMDGSDQLDSLQVHNIITHGNGAAVNGQMAMKNKKGEVRNYGFCDVYGFSGFKDAKIKVLTSYIVAIDPSA